MCALILVSIFGSLKGNNRQNNILQHIDTEIVFVAADFNHGKKRYMTTDEAKDIHCFHVPTYKKNLSVKRIFSHIAFAYQLRKYLFFLSEIPSAIYCAMPTSTAAYVCGKYCKKHGVKFVIDVIDLWPDSLLPLVGGVRYKLLKFFLYPWKYITVQSYKMADVIIGESKVYANVAASYNKKAPVFSLYLGVDKQNVETLIAESKLEINKPEGELWIAYGGSLGISYDFETLIKGIAALNGKYQYKLFFIGDGVCRGKVEEWIEQYSINAEITGFLEYGDLLNYLFYCDIAINIFRDNSKVVHSYKFNDYVATNCFILNSLPGETAEIIDKYQIGLNFDFRMNTLDKVLLHCVDQWNLYKGWKMNNERLIAEILDKKLIYSKMRDILLT